MDNLHNRNFMKSPLYAEAMAKSDQASGKPQPPLVKEVEGKIIELPPFSEPDASYAILLDIRRSVRTFSDTPMTQEQLAFMLYSAQGIQQYRGRKEVITLRPVPSGGARHPFETYIIVQNVDGLEAGLYHYAPATHAEAKKVSIVFMGPLDEEYKNSKLIIGQNWTDSAHILLFLTFVPYRSEWRYGEVSHRMGLIDSGHIGQNIMLSASALELGSCCIASYDQKMCDKALKVDGTEEYTVYAAAVGTI